MKVNRLKKKFFEIREEINLKIREFWLQRDFHRYHISIRQKGDRCRVVIMRHIDFIRAMDERIRRYKQNQSFEEFIKFCLSQAIKGCNFIIFRNYDEEENTRFIQFWTRSGFLYMDITKTPTNGMDFYWDPVLQLLKDFGFRRTKNCLNFWINDKRRYYSTERERNMLILNANFKKDIDLAAKVTVKIIREILQIDEDYLDMELG